MGIGRVAPGGVVLIAFALRVIGLDRQELRGDEAFGYFFSLPAPETIVQRTLALGEPHPVASYWAQHGWMALAGQTEFALRFTGVFWSVLAVALVYGFARSLGLARHVAVAAATLTAFSPYLVWHAQDARMYNMSLALTLASTVALVNWWRKPSRQVGILYVGLTLLALHTHYYAAYIVAAQGAGALVLSWRQRRWRWAALAYPVVAGLAFLPWLVMVRHVLAGYHGNGDSPTLPAALGRGLSAFVLGDGAPGMARWSVTVLVVVACVVGGRRLWRAVPDSVLWLAVYAGIPLLATWASAQTRPIFDERYLAAVTPPVYLLAAGTVALPRRGWWGPVVYALVAGSMIFGLVRGYTDPAYSKTIGWRELAATMVRLVDGVPATQVRLIQNYPDPTLWYYTGNRFPGLALPPAAADAEGAAAAVDELVLSGVTRVVLAQQAAPQWDGDGIARAALGARYASLEATPVGNWRVTIFWQPPPPVTPVVANFENRVQLVSASVAPERLDDGDLLMVTIAWARFGVEEELAVSIQMLDGTGHLVAQQDLPLPSDESTSVAYGILTPEGLDAGDYRVVAVVYRAQAAGAPRLTTDRGEDNVMLGTVVVTDENQE